MNSLLFAKTPEEVRKLVNSGMDPNKIYMGGPTPLFMAYEIHRNIDVATELVKCGAIPESNMIIDAAKCGYANFLDACFSFGGINPNDYCKSEEDNIFTFACKNGYHDVIDCFFKYGLDMKRIYYITGFNWCCRNGDAILIGTLIKMGAVPDDDCMTGAILNDHISVIDGLAFGGIDLNSMTKFNVTFLSFAVMMEKEAIVKRLIDFGADINYRDASGKTCLFHTKNRNFLKMLIDEGADPTIRNNEGFLYND